MSLTKFVLGFFLVVFLSFAKSELVDYWVPIEFSHFLIFFIIRSSTMVRALVLTFILSVGADILLQAHVIKGFAAISHLLLVYIVMHLKEHVVPAFEDLFLLGFFAIFYFVNYYIQLGLGELLGVAVQSISFPRLLFHTVFHMAAFGVLLNISNRLTRGTE
jgi:hypothetical protein